MSVSLHMQMRKLPHGGRPVPADIIRSIMLRRGIASAKAHLYCPVLSQSKGNIIINQTDISLWRVVYLGQHLRLDKKVVLKADKRRLSTSQEALKREVNILKELSQTYIPQVYDFVNSNSPFNTTNMQSLPC